MPRAQHLLRSTILVFGILGLNKATGFVKLLLVTRFFGTGAESDAYLSANQLPELFFSLLTGGALSAALIPVYSAYLSAGDSENARSLANTVLTIALSVLTIICGIAALFAPWIMRVILVPEFSPAQQSMTADLMRIALIATVIFGLSSIVSSLLYAHQHFFLPALSTVFVDLGQIVGLYTLAPTNGIYSVPWGSVFGASFALLIQMPAFMRYGIARRPQLALHLSGLHELFVLLGPRVITLSTFQAVDLVFIRLASNLSEGSISAFFYALLIMIGMPKELFGNAISTVLFPTMAEQYNEGKADQLRQTLTLGLRAAWALAVPAAVGLVVLGKPAVSFLLERGSFDAAATDLVYALMVILALRLIAEVSSNILSLSFFAQHNTSIPMWANLGWMLLNIILSYLLVSQGGIRGLAWATTLSALALACAMYYLNRWTVGIRDELTVGKTILTILFATLCMTGTVLLIQALELETLPYLITAICGGGLVYIATYFALNQRDVLILWQTLRSSQTNQEPREELQIVNN
ncbi:murein biosynthesis integral membrane protein MurJ [Chloroflexi bacterium TSY]|nr:murein biosynthesis integral membrane protein MurJ [Chloroflexi bacterium TSY]